MKISLVTSDTDLAENQRIKEEIENLGTYEFETVNFNDFQISYVEGKINFLPKVSGDIAIIRGLFSAMRSLSPLEGYLKSVNIKVFDNNLFAHSYSINKIDDITKLIFAGVATPDFYHGRSFAALNKFADSMSYPAVIKVAGAGKGASIYKAKDPEELKFYLSKWEKEEYSPRGLVIQNFIDYKYDLRVLVIGTEMFTMRRIPKTGDFRANFSLGGSVEKFEITPEIKALAKKACETIGLEVAGVDVLIDKNGKLCILEVNHTPGFVGMEKALGANIGKIYVDYCLKNARKLS